MTFLPLTEFERSQIKQIGPILTSEEQIYLTEDGTAILHTGRHPAAGGLLEPVIIERLVNGEKLKLLHNRPSGASLNSSDWAVMAEYYGQLEMIVAVPSGSIHRAQVPFDFQVDEVKKLVKGLNTTFNQLSSMIHPPMIPLSMPDMLVQAHRFPTLYINEHLYGLGIVDFSLELSLKDYVDLVNLKRLPIRKEWHRLLREKYA
ncbi:hypothetical protein ASF70_12715 [Rhizobium sp. Leaf321]|uniref:hypothetical protein n=1 Tax=Rhizobium sp. Leaf321 TaxID=1736335 RepID=UPI0007123B71|nr:hypothetical protein [Rhizobium sp. Leaf321]KQQ72390.1 hypothetical protein ASF70_12715 [Rhizobium sp. Leaf321]